LSYALFVDDGQGGAFNEVDSASIRNKPYIQTYVISGLTGSGNTFKIKLQVINEVGLSESLSLS
jgi:hypothetical protein